MVRATPSNSGSVAYYLVMRTMLISDFNRKGLIVTLQQQRDLSNKNHVYLTILKKKRYIYGSQVEFRLTSIII